MSYLHWKPFVKYLGWSRRISRRNGHHGWRVGLCCLVCGWLQACGTPVVVSPPPVVAGSGGSAATKPVLSGGKYYQDDGPGADAPADLDSLPDAEPKLEKIVPATSRPYTVMNQTYVPLAENAPYKAQGEASWYGRKYHGKKTSSGEVYNMYTMTAAHTVLPLPSYARVTNLENGKSVIVKVNDRGPFLQNRIIDLSFAAAYKLGYVNKGRARVEVERLMPEDIRAGRYAKAKAPGLPLLATQPQAAPVIPAPAAEPVLTDLKGTFVQLGAFSSEDAASRFRDQISRELGGLSQQAHVLKVDALYKVFLGPYPDRVAAAADFAKVQADAGFKPLFVTR